MCECECECEYECRCGDVGCGYEYTTNYQVLDRLAFYAVFLSM